MNALSSTPGAIACCPSVLLVPSCNVQMGMLGWLSFSIGHIRCGIVRWPVRVASCRYAKSDKLGRMSFFPSDI